MMPAPPKVWPDRPEPEPEPLVPPEPKAPVAPVEPALPELSVDPGVPAELVPLIPVSDDPKLELPPGELEPKGEFEKPPAVEAPAIPLPPEGPTPARVAALPARGWPKNPITVGVLFWPNMTGFQSSLPVIGSVYFLRRKWMS